MSSRQKNIQDGLFAPNDPPPWEKKALCPSPVARLFWALGTCLLIVLLATQILWHDGNRLAQNPATRPWLEKLCEALQGRICRTLNWQLPEYRNTALIDIVDHSVNRRSDGVLEFKVILASRAEYPQPFPSIQMTLLKFNGDPLATRVLPSDAYLPDDMRGKLMPLDNPVDIRFHIMKLNTQLGGYRFELI